TCLPHIRDVVRHVRLVVGFGPGTLRRGPGDRRRYLDAVPRKRWTSVIPAAAVVKTARPGSGTRSTMSACARPDRRATRRDAGRRVGGRQAGPVHGRLVLRAGPRQDLWTGIGVDAC